MALFPDSQIDAKNESQIVHQHVEASPTSALENDETLVLRRQIEKRLVWKLDLTILPLLASVFFFSYVDRGQIGNARLMGLGKDLNITADQYYNCLLVFFIGYAFIELPCCLGIIYIKPGHQFGLATITFGLLATLISVCKGYGSLVAIRFLLGLAEAFVQVSFIYLSLWYRRDEIALRSALFYISGPLAGAFSGLIAYSVQKNLDGDRGLASWQWLFIVEGVPTIAWGVLVFITLPSRPETVAKEGSWLFPGKIEQELILERTVAGKNELHVQFQMHQVVDAFKDIKVYLDLLLMGAIGLALAAFSLFMPTFIKGFGFDTLHTQLFTIIPYACATIMLPIICRIADLYTMRGPLLLFCYVMVVTGVILLMATAHRASLIVGTCLVASGTYSQVILGATWVMTSYGGYTKRSTAWAMAQISIQCLSILGTKIYNTPPRFLKGHTILISVQALGLACGLTKYWIMRRSNRRKDAEKLEYESAGEPVPGMERSLEELNDSHPAFRYVL